MKKLLISIVCIVSVYGTFDMRIPAEKKVFYQYCMHSFPWSGTYPISQNLGNYTEKNILYPVNHNLHPNHTLQVCSTDCVSYLSGDKK